MEKTNTSTMRFYERSGYSVFRDDGNRFLLKKEMEDLFCDALREKDTGKLLSVPKSDLHNHSTKGCRRAWLAEKLKRNLPDPPVPLDGLSGMQEWFRSALKPFCDGQEGVLLRWEGAFAEAKRNHSLCWNLIRDKVMTEEEERLFFSIDEWFKAELPEPQPCKNHETVITCVILVKPVKK